MYVSLLGKEIFPQAPPPCPPNRPPSNLYWAEIIICSYVNNGRGIGTKIVRLDRQLSLLRVGLCFPESHEGGANTSTKKAHSCMCVCVWWVLPAR